MNALLREAGVRAPAVDVIGFHGQTIFHQTVRLAESVGRTVQIGSGRILADETQINVVADFRSNDVRAGGEGAPLAPIYHQALVRTLDPLPEGPIGVLNIGGVANVTYVPDNDDPDHLIAFDCGPGNGLIDEWMELKTGEAMDVDGALAASGTVHEETLRMMLLNPFLRRKPPKSLDRYDFKLGPVDEFDARRRRGDAYRLYGALCGQSRQTFP